MFHVLGGCDVLMFCTDSLGPGTHGSTDDEDDHSAGLRLGPRLERL